LWVQSEEEAIWPPTLAYNLDISLASSVKKHLKVIKGEFVVIVLNAKKKTMKG
jgi:hypothetical protein